MWALLALGFCFMVLAGYKELLSPKTEFYEQKITAVKMVMALIGIMVIFLLPSCASATWKLDQLNKCEATFYTEPISKMSSREFKKLQEEEQKLLQSMDGCIIKTIHWKNKTWSMIL